MKHSFLRWRWWAVVAAIATLLVGDVLYSADAVARSGGSFGGGFKSRSSSSSSSSRSFGSSSSSRSFGSSSSSSRSSSSSSSYRPSSYGGTRYVPVPVPVGGYGGSYGGSYGGYRPGYSSYGYASPTSGRGWVSTLVLLLVLAFIVFVIVLIVRRRRAASADGGAVQDSDPPVDLTLLQFGVQIQARNIQDKLEKLAERTNADDEGSLAFALRTLAQELIAQSEYVEYAAVQRLHALPLARAEDQFNLWAGNERAKFNREVIRGGRSGVQRQQKEWKTDGIRDEDGQLAVAEFFVISVVLASRTLALPNQLMDSAALAEVLEALAGVRTEQLVALEVVWSPAAMSDSMGRDDMTSRYPSLISL